VALVLQLGEEIGVPHGVRGKILEVLAEFGALVHQQLVPGVPVRGNDRFVDVDRHHELRTMEVLVKTMIIRDQFHSSLRPDVLAEESPPGGLLVWQVAW